MMQVGGTVQQHHTRFGRDGALGALTCNREITEIMDHGDGAGNTLDFPMVIAVGNSDSMYVTGHLSGNAFKLTLGGAIAAIVDATGDGADNTLALPEGVAVDSSGNLYVTGSGSALHRDERHKHGRRHVSGILATLLSVRRESSAIPKRSSESCSTTAPICSGTRTSSDENTRTDANAGANVRATTL